MLTFKRCLSWFVFFISWLQLYAQDQDSSFYMGCCCHSSNYHAPIGIMIDRIHEKGEWMVSYRYMNTMMEGNLMGEEKISPEKIYQNNYVMSYDKMQMQMHMLMLMYGLSDKITLMGMFNYVQNSMEMSMASAGGHVHGGASSLNNNPLSKTSGLGDMKFYAVYSLINKERKQLFLSGGVSIPTGSIYLRGNTMWGENDRSTYSMQTGSGSFSLLPGITYTGYSNSFSWGTQLTSDIKTGINQAGYKYGNELILNSWIACKWNDWLSNSIRINGNAIGKIKGFDPEIARYWTVDPDANINNSGGYKTNIFAGVNFLIPRGSLAGHRLGLELGIPVYQNVNGIQIRTKAILNAGWQYAF